MASSEGSANLDANLGEAIFLSKRSNVRHRRDSRLSFEAQIPLRPKKSGQSINVDPEVVGTARFPHVDAESLAEIVAREVKELSFGDGADRSLPLSYVSDTTSDREAVSCPLHNATRRGTGRTFHEQIAPEVSGVVTQLGMGIETASVRDIEVEKDTPLELKGQHEQKKFSCNNSERSMENILQEGNCSGPSGMAMTQKKCDGSFYECVGSIERGLDLNLGKENVQSNERLGYGGVGSTERGHELNLGKENVQIHERLASTVESAPGDSLPSIPGLSIENVLGRLMCKMHHKTPEKVYSLMEDSIRAFEGEPHVAYHERIEESQPNSFPEERNQSCEVALENYGVKKCDCGPESYGRAVEMATTGTQLNPDLEAAFTGSSVNGKSVRAFLGALEALSKETALELNGSPRRVSYDSPEKKPKGKMRNQSLHPNANDHDEREAISDFDIDTPLSCIFKPKRGVPSTNANVEAPEVSERLGSSSGVSLSDPEVTASTSGSDARDLPPLRLCSEGLGRDGTYVGLGVDTGAQGVTPLTLGIASAGGVMEVLIPRSTPIPTKKVVVFSTFVDYQTEVQIQIFEGERFRTMDNKLIGTFEFSGIPAAPRGVAQICVSFEIDARGILNVFVKGKSTGTQRQVAIVPTICSLSKETVEEMIEDGERHRLEDETHKRRIDAKSSLEAYTYQLRDWISDEEVCKNLDPNDKEKMDEAVESVINWLLYKSWLFHCYNQLDEAAEFGQKHMELKSVCTPILESIYQEVTTPRSI